MFHVIYDALGAILIAPGDFKCHRLGHQRKKNRGCTAVIHIESEVGIRRVSIGRLALVLGMLTLCSLVAQASEAQSDTSCGYFSDMPDDRSGPPITFYADLTDDAQSKPTESPGIGRADFVLERETLRLSWRISYQDLTSKPAGLYIHGPKAPAVDAPVLFDITPQVFSSPVQGERVLTLGEATNLLQHLLYVNLHTLKYPEGELRGSVKKLRLGC